MQRAVSVSTPTLLNAAMTAAALLVNVSLDANISPMPCSNVLDVYHGLHNTKWIFLSNALRH
jgi:hypothetical protein